MGIAVDGYEVHPQVLSGGEVSAAADAISGVTIRSRAGARHLMRHPEVAALANDQRLLRLAGSALGAGARPFRATLFDKSPAANWLVVWHQDTALPLRARRPIAGWGPWSVKAGVVYAQAPAAALESVVALRVHLDESAPENGPLRVLPGTHTQGVLSDEAIRELASRVRPHQATCPRGGVVVMRPLLVHASSKAATASSRRVLHIEYARTLLLADGIELAIA
jgi:ectoine hydroxylase-related dioxygenase (phytanoyl-CoA dioxygenase family)